MGCPLIVSPGTELPPCSSAPGTAPWQQGCSSGGEALCQDTLCPLPPVCLAVGHQHTARPPQVNATLLAQVPAWLWVHAGQDTQLSIQGSVPAQCVPVSSLYCSTSTPV